MLRPSSLAERLQRSQVESLAAWLSTSTCLALSCISPRPLWIRVADLFAAESRVASECYRFSSAAGAELGQNVADQIADAFR